METKLIQYLTVTLDSNLKPDSTFIGTAVQSTEYAYILKIYAPNIDVTKDSCYLAVELPTSQLESNKIKLPVNLCADFESSSNGLYLAQIELDNRVVKYPGNVLCNVVIQHDTGDKTTEEINGIAREVAVYTTLASESFNIKVLRSANYDEILYHNDEDYDDVSDHLNAIMASLARYKRNISSNANCIWYEATCPTGDLTQYKDSCIFTFDDHSIYLIDENLTCTKIARLYDTSYDTKMAKLDEAIENANTATNATTIKLNEETERIQAQVKECADATASCATQTANCANETSKCAEATASVAQATASCAEQTANCATATANCATETAKATQAAADATTAMSGMADKIVEVMEEQLGIEGSDLNTLEGYREDCQQAAEDAQTAASNANTYAGQANTSASNANTYAGNASTSADSASTSATNASNYAGQAGISADAASTSATNAKTSETNAATSESNAKSYMDNAYYWSQQVKSYQHNFCLNVRTYAGYDTNAYARFKGTAFQCTQWGRIWFNVHSSGSTSPLTSDGIAYDTFYTMLKTLAPSKFVTNSTDWDTYFKAGLIPATGYLCPSSSYDELVYEILGIGADTSVNNQIVLFAKLVNDPDNIDLVSIQLPLHSTVGDKSSGLYGGEDTIVQVAGV